MRRARAKEMAQMKQPSASFNNPPRGNQARIKAKAVARSEDRTDPDSTASPDAIWTK